MSHEARLEKWLSDQDHLFFSENPSSVPSTLTFKNYSRPSGEWCGVFMAFPPRLPSQGLRRPQFHLDPSPTAAASSPHPGGHKGCNVYNSIISLALFTFSLGTPLDVW